MTTIAPESIATAARAPAHGPLPLLNRAVAGDALEQLELLPGDYFAVIVTSPPYNHGVSNPAIKAGRGDGRKKRWKGGYSGFDDALPEDEYVAYHRDVMGHLLRVLRPDGLLWYVHHRKPRYDADGAESLADRVLRGFPVRSELIWDKGGPGAGFCAAGRDQGCYYPTPSYESIFLLAKDESALLDRQLAAQGDIWTFPRHRVTGHPATFPVGLALQCLRGTLAPGPVLDPFLGSGTVGVAARMTGRPWLGVERSPAYLRLARRRISGRVGAFEDWEVPDPDDEAGAAQTRLF